MSRWAAGIAKRMAEELKELGNAERAAHEKRYLRSGLRHFGTPVPSIRKVATRFAREHPALARGALMELVDELWSRGIHELRMACIELLVFDIDTLRPSDIERIEQLLRDSKTWALVDNLATNVTGPLVERFPKLAQTLDRWARDDDVWVRRAAMLALLRPLRRGHGDFARFSFYADAMLDEKELVVRKAIGWVLRETSKSSPQAVYEWLAPRTHRASGVTMREAVKRLPEAQQRALMNAYRERRPAV